MSLNSFEINESRGNFDGRLCRYFSGIEFFRVSSLVEHEIVAASMSGR
jgi:hypothetical protein